MLKTVLNNVQSINQPLMPFHVWARRKCWLPTFFFLFQQCFLLSQNGRKLYKRVENDVGKGEIACYEQFLLFPKYFQKACFPGASKGVIVWEWVKLSSANTFNLDCSIILLERKEF